MVPITEEVLLEEKMGGIPDGDNNESPDGLCRMKMVEVDGVRMSLSACLRQTLTSELASESSRIRRYRGQTKAGTDIIDEELVDHGDADYVRAAEHPIATIVCATVNCAKCFALIVFSPESFLVEGEKSSVSQITKDQFKGMTRVKGKIIFIHSSEEEISWKIQARSLLEIEVYAKDSSLINPAMRTIMTAAPEFYISRQDAHAVLEKLCLGYKDTVLPDLSKHATQVPYTYDKKPILYSMIDDVNIVLSSRVSNAGKRAEKIDVTCFIKGCTERFDVKKLRHHVSWHIFHDQDLVTKVCPVPVSKLCSICGTSKASTYTEAPENCCSLYLRKKGRTWNFEFKCCKVKSFSIGYKAALKSVKSAPSTNVPIECPICSAGGGMKQEIPKYNFLQHWEDHHKTLEMSEELKDSITIDDTEIENLKEFKYGKTGTGKKKAKYKRSTAKKDMHMNDTPIKDTPKKNTGKGTGTYRHETTSGNIKKIVPFRQVCESSKLVLANVFEESTKQNVQEDEHILLLQNMSKEIKDKAIDIIKSAVRYGNKSDIWEFQYRYLDKVVKLDSIARLHGTTFINDEVMDMLVKVINTRNANRISTDSSYPKRIVVNSYFGTGLSGQNLPSQKVNGPFLEMSDDDVLFIKVNADKFMLGTHKYPGNWEKTLHSNAHKGSCTLVDLATNQRLDTVVFQMNIAEYHWFFITINFMTERIVAYDSMISSVLKDGSMEHLVPYGEGEDVFACLSDTKLGDINEEILESLCRSVGINSASDKTNTLRNLMRPMMVQLLYKFLQSENNRTESKQRKLDLKDWSLVLSSDMPQQNPVRNACGLFTTAGCDIISSGGDVSLLKSKASILEKQGRECLAAICCLTKGEKEEIKAVGISTN